VLGIALIAMGEEIGAEMALRTFGHLVSTAWRRLEIYWCRCLEFPGGDFPDGFSRWRNSLLAMPVVQNLIKSPFTHQSVPITEFVVLLPMMLSLFSFIAS